MEKCHARAFPLTVEAVKNRVAQIHAVAEQDLVEAHQLEDDLWMEVLVNIGKGVEHSKELANEALNSLLADFERYYQP